MSENLKNSSVATGLEKSVFIPIPKKSSAKDYTNYLTIALIHMIVRLFSKSFKLGFSSTWTKNFQM